MIGEGLKAQVRTMVFLAGEPIPRFWPMRSFIHHNPLHGLEKMKFEQAVEKGEQLFHGRAYLPRDLYQQYLRDGKIDECILEACITKFASMQTRIEGVELEKWLKSLVYSFPRNVISRDHFIPQSVMNSDITSVLQGRFVREAAGMDCEELTLKLEDVLIHRGSIQEIIDKLFGTELASQLDDLIVRNCLNFFDEGQAAWEMPSRENGFFNAWLAVFGKSGSFMLSKRVLQEVLESVTCPEEAIIYVMRNFKIPESHWQSYFQRELTRLHGWAGFIRWRSSALHYYFTRKYPGDLVDYLAIRLILSHALVDKQVASSMPKNMEDLKGYIRENTTRAYLAYQYHSGNVIPSFAHRIEKALFSGKQTRVESVATDYFHYERESIATQHAQNLRRLSTSVNAEQQLLALDADGIGNLVRCIEKFERREGLYWLKAMEEKAINELLRNISLMPSKQLVNRKRPFVQAMFCIDTRSERLRRHLENVGDYQTFGIAGFFGVPVSFMEIDKGTEVHLCPVLLTPKNLIMEMSVSGVQDTVALSIIEKVVHELKETVLAPYVTVEAIGLLFGLDMFGKTMMPVVYNRWRTKLHKHKPFTHLLIDKLSREQADSIVRAVQRALISKAIEIEFKLSPEQVNDDVVRELREVALGNIDHADSFQKLFNVDDVRLNEFIEQLRDVYRVNKSESRHQMERLGRIGFTLDEQVTFVSQALQAIGLTKVFSRFVLVVGHGSQSQNNPYESALDCGACGGNVGLHNARIFAGMANKPAVRQRLRAIGIDIPDDTWFIPALHNTTIDEIIMYDLDLVPATHLIYLDRLRQGLTAACRLCAKERIPELGEDIYPVSNGVRKAMRNALDWSQVRPEWGLSRNAYFIIGRRGMTRNISLEGRAFMHSYDYRVDHNLILLENILTGPLVVAQWINMEHYFSAVDNESYGSGSKVYHNVAGRFGVMTGNIGDLRTGLPAQTVLMNGKPYHEPLRLMTLIESPLESVKTAIGRVASVRKLLQNEWIHMAVVDPISGGVYRYCAGDWKAYDIGDLHAGREAAAI